jgi:hypothetical protein
MRDFTTSQAKPTSEETYESSLEPSWYGNLFTALEESNVFSFC